LLKYIAADGSEITLAAPEDLVKAVRDGHLTSQSLLSDAGSGCWQEARTVPAFQHASRLLKAYSPREPIGELKTSSGKQQDPQTALAEGDSEGIRCPGCGAVNRSDALVCFNCHRHLDRATRTEVLQDAHGVIPSPERPVLQAPTHELRGKLFVVLAYVGAVILGIGASAVLVLAVAEGERGLGFLWAGFMGSLSALHVYLARGIARFRETARVIALVLLYLAALGYVITILSEQEPIPVIGSLIAGPITILFIHYFHSRRRLFAGARGGTVSVVSIQPHPPMGGAERGGTPNDEVRTWVVKCPRCTNSEELPWNDRCSEDVYARFRVRIGFLSGQWTLTCSICETRFDYNPYHIEPLGERFP
jgi:hypothetical protein